MRINFLLSLAALFTVLLSNACTKQIAEPLQELQELRYTNSWERLNAYPIRRGRTDDLHFFDPQTGFVINSEGYVVYTEDGGESWEVVHENEGTFFRCITFKNRQEGWLGTIGTDDRFLSSNDSIALYDTKDGGLSWQPVQFIGPQPKGLCGLQKVNDQFIVGCGRVRGPSYFIKTNDGGKNWYSYNLNHIAGSLIAPYFFDESHGFLIGGTTTDKKNCRSLVLETHDGGTSWDTVYVSSQKGEYCWKFSFPTPELGYISIQRNVRDGRFYYLKTSDGGKNWEEVEYVSSYYYVQGIGFITPKIGWMGGSNNWTYETRDGGQSWNKVKDIGRGFNNFQFFGDTLAYGVGFGVYKSQNIKSALSRSVDTHYDNGQLMRRYTFEDGQRSGPAATYFASGQLKSSGAYKANLKHGLWKFYNEQGQMIKKVRLKNGLAKVAAKQLQPYVGRYKTPEGDFRKIFLKEGHLHSQRGNGAIRKLYPQSDASFFYEHNTAIEIEFCADKSGKITHTRMFQNGKYAEAVKVD